MEWLESKQIKVTPPKRPKKLTGTRLASIFGLNPWKTPFATWCEITRTYEEPFEETIYTKAGKTIEGIQIEYMKKKYYMIDILTPTDVYGEDYFNKTYGDFFHDVSPIFGGMWDSIRSSKGKTTAVLEFKTSKRTEDWRGEIPEYYTIQAALYAYLLGVDDVVMVASFLEQSDYAHPEKFQPSVQNTVTLPFKLSKRYPKFKEDYIDTAIEWWNKYVVGGISPEYDEKMDEDILKILRTNSLPLDTDIETVIADAEALKAEIDKTKADSKSTNDNYKKLCDFIKNYAMQQFRDGDNKVAMKGQSYVWVVSKSNTSKIDTEALKRDGLYEKYLISEPSYKLTQTIIKENKS